MRKLPQDFAFPLGLGSKRNQNANSNHQNGGIVQNSANNDKITNVLPAPNQFTDGGRRSPSQDLDTIIL